MRTARERATRHAASILGLASLLLAMVVVAPSAAAAAAAGQIFQHDGASGCTSEIGFEGCATGRGLLGASSAAVSPDGRNVYVTGSNSDSLSTFLRDRRSGRVVQPRNLSGCVSQTGQDQCATGRGLELAWSVAVSPDGASVYVASRIGLAVFARNTSTGKLRQLAGGHGCLNAFAAAQGCAPARGIRGSTDVVVSPDGQHVYASGFGSRAVAVFDRDGATGALSQAPGASGCISSGGNEGCGPGRGLQGAFSVALSPSGEYLYVAGETSNAVAVFARDGDTGALRQLPGAGGCVAEGGVEGCMPARALEAPNGLAIAPDGGDLYVAAGRSDAVAMFRINADGTLNQRPGPDGCIGLDATEGCSTAASLDQPYAVTVSPDGRNVYIASEREVTSLRRGPDGSLGVLGCVSQGGASGCATGRALERPSSIALAPGGNHAYVTADGSGALSSFARDPHGGRVRVRIRNVPHSCARRRFQARVRVDSVLPLRKVRVFVNGRQVHAGTEPRLVVKVRPRQLRRHRHRLNVTAVDIRGNRDRRAVTFRRC